MVRHSMNDDQPLPFIAATNPVLDDLSVIVLKVPRESSAVSGMDITLTLR
jgi:hypothetical protein